MTSKRSKYAASRHRLSACPQCGRHTRIGRTPKLSRCEHCDTGFLSSERVRRTAARLSGRGGLIAASLLAASATGCGSAETPPPPDPVVTPEAPEREAETDPEREAETDPDQDPEWSEAPDEPPVDMYGMPPVEGEDEAAEDQTQEVGPVRPVPVPAYGIAPPPPIPE